ncbi:hypothetical protein [Nitrospira sp. BLG_1]|uniref:hypothetical protein n=1 Tax=Nitrospira sp. BLG_1 TaxID=3395883 RepID=UPI0039BC5C61
MDFRIADTFTDSLTRLTGEEHKAVEVKSKKCDMAFNLNHSTDASVLLRDLNPSLSPTAINPFNHGY